MSRKIKKNYSKWFLTKVKQASKSYNMLEDGDRIAVGVSGGKDSMVLLFILNLLKKWTPINFEFYAVSLDLGFKNDFTPVEEFCEEENIPFHLEHTNIGKIVFEIKQEKNPCALCSNLRSGALNKTAIKLNCSKVALGHHLDDAIETYFLNLFYTGQFNTFSPKTYLDRKELWLIRPMIYLTDSTVASIADRENLPIVKNACPVSGKTKRDEMKEIVKSLQNYHPDVKRRFLSAFLSGMPNWKP